MARTRFAGIAAIVGAISLHAAPLLAATTGNIEGHVTDEATGKPLPGVTVSATGPQGEQTEFTGSDGRYLITNLTPGEYLVRFYFSNVTVERPAVVVQADKTLSVSAAIPLVKAEKQTYRITQRAPSVDVANTQVQTQVTDELVRNAPVGKTGRNYKWATTCVTSTAP